MKKIIFSALILCGFGAAFAQCEQSVFAKKDGYALYSIQAKGKTSDKTLRIQVEKNEPIDEQGNASSQLRVQKMYSGGVYQEGQRVEWSCEGFDWMISAPLFEIQVSQEGENGAYTRFQSTQISYPTFIGEIEDIEIGQDATDYEYTETVSTSNNTKPNIRKTQVTSRMALRQETISTPAGEFEAWLYMSQKTSAVEGMEMLSSKTWIVKEWICTDLNLIVKYTEEGEDGLTQYELIKYSK